MSSTISDIATATSSAVASATTTAAESSTKSGGLKVVGVILAITSGLLIGSSFVFKKKGLLASQKDGAVLGEGVAYLKSWLWWTGMIMMIAGELCNFAAYAFVDAVVVTPLGALSVVICAILSSIFLKETLTFFGWMGCGLSIVGSVIIALNGPQEQAVSTISEFQKLFFAPGFLVFGSILIIASLIVIFFFAPKYGKKNMIWYISVCSMIGGLSVSCIQGLGAAIVTTAQGNNQFKQWFTYFLMVFVTVTLLTEIYYLNVALALFNTAMVTPTYYVIFTACTLITSVVLYQGLKSTVTQILTVVMGFFVICAGIVILQMSKVDPEKLGKLDRRSTILLKANQQTVEHNEKLTGLEDPGIDALRGSFGTVGSIIRARSARRLSMSSRPSQSRPGRGMRTDLESVAGSPPPAERNTNRLSTHGLDHLPRHQLYDAPVRPSTDTLASDDTISELPQRKSQVSNAMSSPRQPTIKFQSSDVAHYYPSPGKRGDAVHESRAGAGVGQSGYPATATQRSPGPYQQGPSSRTAPASQTSFGSMYANPFNSPPDTARPLSTAPLSQSNTLMSDLSTDSIAAFGGSHDSPDPYDSPPETRVSARRYPSSRGSEDQYERQGLVGGTGRDSPDDEGGNGNGPRPGGVRLLPSLPKMRDQL